MVSSIGSTRCNCRCRRAGELLILTVTCSDLTLGALRNIRSKSHSAATRKRVICRALWRVERRRSWCAGGRTAIRTGRWSHRSASSSRGTEVLRLHPPLPAGHPVVKCKAYERYYKDVGTTMRQHLAQVLNQRRYKKSAALTFQTSMQVRVRVHEQHNSA